MGSGSEPEPKEQKRETLCLKQHMPCWSRTAKNLKNENKEVLQF